MNEFESIMLYSTERFSVNFEILNVTSDFVISHRRVFEMRRSNPMQVMVTRFNPSSGGATTLKINFLVSNAHFKIKFCTWHVLLLAVFLSL